MRNYEKETSIRVATHHSPSNTFNTMQAACQGNGTCANLPEYSDHSFANPFHIEDLLVFEQRHIERVLAMTQLAPEHLAWALHDASSSLVQRVYACLSADKQAAFCAALEQPIAEDYAAQARHVLLDKLFWELTYWKTPELYEELVAGEHLHPAIFQQLEPLLRHNTVLDAGAGCGRATFAAIEHGAALVYAVEPSPGLRHLLAEKLTTVPAVASIVIQDGDFAHVPLPGQSVDVALTCSAFTAAASQGGEAGLIELRRVTRTGGYIVLIWPRQEDLPWLAEHGFHYVTFPQEQEMYLSFASWHSAWRCAHRFYAHNQSALRYLRNAQRPRLPFSVLGCNAPRNYCWLQVNR